MSTDAEKQKLENGEQILPCRCGTTHRGPYAIYDYAHHNCFHDDPLVTVDEEIPGYLMCPSCGKPFTVAVSTGGTP